MKESCWGKILKVFKCQVKSLGHFYSSVQGDPEVISFLREKLM